MQRALRLNVSAHSNLHPRLNSSVVPPFVVVADLNNRMFKIGIASVVAALAAFAFTSNGGKLHKPELPLFWFYPMQWALCVLLPGSLGIFFSRNVKPATSHGLVGPVIGAVTMVASGYAFIFLSPMFGRGGDGSAFEAGSVFLASLFMFPVAAILGAIGWHLGGQ